MAATGKRVKDELGSMSDVLVKKDRKRMLLISITVVLVAVAVILSLAKLAYHGNGGCNAALPTQRYSCLSALAAQSGNVIVCNNIGNSGVRSSCIMSIAEQRRNTTDCNAFSGSDRTSCVMNVSYIASDASLCGSLDSTNQSYCTYNIAMKANFSDYSTCGGISEPSYENLCAIQSYYHTALATRNYSYCGKLPQSRNSTVVYAMASQDPNYQSSESSLLTAFVNITPSDFCYATVPSTNTTASCAYISNLSLRSSCQSATMQSNTVYDIQNMTAECTHAGSPQLENVCYFGIYANAAVQTSNVSLCSKISNTSYMSNCVVDVATADMNTTYCNVLQNSTQKSACIYNAELSNGNYT